jgi:hypothetical protein
MEEAGVKNPFDSLWPRRGTVFTSHIAVAKAFTASALINSQIL